jgi:hypothetical protein
MQNAECGMKKNTPNSELFCTFAAANVERFDLIATTRKNAKPMLFPSHSVNCFPHKFIIN